MGVGLLSAVLLAELGLRTLVASDPQGRMSGFSSYVNQVHSEPVSHSIYRVSDDPVLGVELIPASSRSHVRVNSGGFRGPEYDLDPGPGVHRIVMLGDSETFGALLREEETLPGSIEAVLNERADDTTYEVLNFGFPGYGTAQELRVLEDRALRYQPHTVVLYYVFNDPIPETQTRVVERSPLYRSYLFSLVRFAGSVNRPSRYQRMHRERGIVGFHSQLIDSHLFDASRDAIHRMGELLARRGIRFIVVIAPEVLGFDSFRDYPYRDLHARLRGLATDRVEVVDPLRSLAALGDDPTELWVTPTDCHKNARANRAVAETVAEVILRTRGKGPAPGG